MSAWGLSDDIHENNTDKYYKKYNYYEYFLYITVEDDDIKESIYNYNDIKLSPGYVDTFYKIHLRMVDKSIGNFEIHYNYFNENDLNNEIKNKIFETAFECIKNLKIKQLQTVQMYDDILKKHKIFKNILRQQKFKNINN